MAYLNANIPPIYCQIRREYLYDLQKHHGEAEDVVVFGITSIAGKAILFHCMLENGAIFYRLPISAFFQKHLHLLKSKPFQESSYQLPSKDQSIQYMLLLVFYIFLFYLLYF